MPLTIGRDKSNSIVFESDKRMSRVHCRFDFLDNDWLISDGISEKKSSGNGTWFYCD